MALHVGTTKKTLTSIFITMRTKNLASSAVVVVNIAGALVDAQTSNHLS